jgi:uncharacterized protein YmfQ (DUF2313 family)
MAFSTAFARRFAYPRRMERFSSAFSGAFAHGSSLRGAARGGDSGAARLTVAAPGRCLGAIRDSGDVRAQGSLPAALGARAWGPDGATAQTSVSFPLSARLRVTAGASTRSRCVRRIEAFAPLADEGAVFDSPILPMALEAAGRIEDFGEECAPFPIKAGFSAAFARRFAHKRERRARRGFSFAFSGAFAGRPAARIIDSAAARLTVIAPILGAAPSLADSGAALAALHIMPREVVASLTDRGAAVATATAAMAIAGSILDQGKIAGDAVLAAELDAAGKIADIGVVSARPALSAEIAASGRIEEIAVAHSRIVSGCRAESALTDTAATALTVAFPASSLARATDHGAVIPHVARPLQTLAGLADSGIAPARPALPAELVGSARVSDAGLVREAFFPAELTTLAGLADSGIAPARPILPAELVAAGGIADTATGGYRINGHLVAESALDDDGLVPARPALPAELAVFDRLPDDAGAATTVTAPALAVDAQVEDGGQVLESPFLPLEPPAHGLIDDSSLALATAQAPLDSDEFYTWARDDGQVYLTTGRGMEALAGSEDAADAWVTARVTLAAVAPLTDDGHADRPLTRLLPRAFGRLDDDGQAEIAASYVPWMPIVPGPTSIAYRQALQALLPLGDAWPRHLDAALTRLLMAWAEELAWVDTRGVRLISESMPASTRELLADWERVAGLPDVCGAELDTTIEERRHALIAMLTRQGGASLAWWQDWGRLQGFGDIVIEEFTPFMCGIHRCGIDRLWGGPRVRYQWRVRISGARYTPFRTGVSACGEKLGKITFADGLECRMRRFKPAHTHIVFHYSQGDGP